MADLAYLTKSPLEKFVYNFLNFFKRLPLAILHFFQKLPGRIWKGLKKFGGIFVTIYRAAARGDWKTRMSFGVMGFGQLARKQWLRGLLYLVLEVAFIFYMIFFGWKYLAQMGSLGRIAELSWDSPDGTTQYVRIDNSLLILLYSFLTIFVIAAVIYAWYQNIKGNLYAQELYEAKQHLATAKDDIRSYADEQYHKTLLAGPMLGVTVFTILPLVFMVFIAFTNFDNAHYPPSRLFGWSGFDNFVMLFGGGANITSAKFAYTFGQVLLWTVIWAFFATFTNYILGMVVALLINKKGIKLKKLWRTCLVMTIAVPQFVSLLLMSQMLADEGAFNFLLGKIGIHIPFLTDATWARVSIIVVNIWIGIPYTMLMVSGILMNIPADLYESARIDGAGPVKMYFKITLPYVLHVTTPYLITSFIGNLNNFNVIFLLSGGGPNSLDYQFAGKTDLLITWLYKLTFQQGSYGIASVISIMMFIITAAVSLIVYNRSGSVKNEEEFM